MWINSLFFFKKSWFESSRRRQFSKKGQSFTNAQRPIQPFLLSTRLDMQAWFLTRVFLRSPEFVKVWHKLIFSFIDLHIEHIVRNSMKLFLYLNKRSHNQSGRINHIKTLFLKNLTKSLCSLQFWLFPDTKSRSSSILYWQMELLLWAGTMTSTDQERNYNSITGASDWNIFVNFDWGVAESALVNYWKFVYDRWSYWGIKVGCEKIMFKFA